MKEKLVCHACNQMFLIIEQKSTIEGNKGQRLYAVRAAYCMLITIDKFLMGTSSLPVLNSSTKKSNLLTQWQIITLLSQQIWHERSLHAWKVNNYYTACGKQILIQFNPKGFKANFISVTWKIQQVSKMTKMNMFFRFHVRISWMNRADHMKIYKICNPWTAPPELRGHRLTVSMFQDSIVPALATRLFVRLVNFQLKTLHLLCKPMYKRAIGQN